MHRRFAIWSDWSTPRTCGRKGGGLTGPSLVDRSKPGSKLHVLSERAGRPLVVGVSAGNCHDCHGLPSATRAAAGRGSPASCTGQGVRPAAAAMVAARQADRRANRPQRRRHLRPVRPTPLGDRANGLLADRLPTPAPPYERRSDLFLAFLILAAALICFKRLRHHTTSDTV